MVGRPAFSPFSLDEIDIEPLAEEAWRDGYRFIERMKHDWATGENRFDGPGERLLGAFEGEALVGFCGLNRDPYVSELVGRIRHLYVGRDHRKKGIARDLLVRALDGAAYWFPRIRLRATPSSRGFYRRMGFVEVDEVEATHARWLD
ncbi:GNAT family N-acetyltransferase [Hoeflea olei]|uniref:N-acetyltransferase domain-containing protein n=1 Tax=Hoeflea olei TaxID=1480615 RepID=A0A1C1YVG6_9HYPH|nr:GNAT family N-acetyltransferase [Hoeflea olei]OCW57533.1 hypothetical protein AWJ14_13355 [Hoeflea olei]